MKEKPKIYIKSLEFAVKLFPQIYLEKNKYRTFHFAFLWGRNKLLSIGVNRSEPKDTKALWFAKKYKIHHRIKYPNLHAEIDAISKLFGKYYIDNNIKLVVIRLNKYLEEQDSKPCSSCQVVLDALGINKIYYTEKSEKWNL